MRFMSAFPSRLLLVVVLLLLPGLAFADEEKPPFPIDGKTDAKYAPFDELMTALLTKYKDLPGVSVAVARDGEIVYARAFGWADRDNKQPLKPESLFRIGSLTKPFTAAAILQLVEKGKLKLDARVMDVLALKPATKKFDERWKKITIRHLLEHRAGWDRSKSLDPVYYSPHIVREMGLKQHPAMPNAIILYMLRQPLDYDPGEKFVYANFGYCLLGRVIEKVSGQSYEAYVKKNVLEPLGIKSMRLGKSLYAQRATNEVRYYGGEKAKAVMGPQLGKPVQPAYGGFSLESMDSIAGWLASPSDLVKFASAFEDPKKCKILKAETVETMFARPADEEKSATYYAKGWLVRPVNLDDKEKLMYWHDASLEGMSGMVTRRPDGITCAVLFNTREKVANTEPAAAIEVPLHAAINTAFGVKKD
jgi:N-acyl-D-amino-acid deacylase